MTPKDTVITRARNLVENESFRKLIEHMREQCLGEGLTDEGHRHARGILEEERELREALAALDQSEDHEWERAKRLTQIFEEEPDPLPTIANPPKPEIPEAPRWYIPEDYSHNLRWHKKPVEVSPPSASFRYVWNSDGTVHRETEPE